jgi:hypothetical protein
MNRVFHSLAFFSLLFFIARTVSAQEIPQQKAAVQGVSAAVEDVIPLTVGNLRGHKMLYDEGWYVVTSSRKAFNYAREKSLISSKEALQQALDQGAKHTADYKEAIKNDVKDSAQTGKNVVTSGTQLSGRIFETTHGLAKTELVYAGDKFQKAMDSLVQGNLSIAKRTEEDRRELACLPGNYFKTVKSDFSNVYDLADSARKRFAAKIDPAWETAFQKASREFQSEYERSGTEQNSLMALGPILYGYLKSFYHGLAAPASKTIVLTGMTGASYVVFLPVTTTAIVAGRTVQSVGLTIYYVGKTGVHIVSPTVEAGLLSGLSLLSLSTVPATYAAGGSLGVVNQVAFSTVGPVAGVVEAAATTSAHTAGYAGFLAYDSVKGATKVVINQAASGIVLGYNALTAIPTHTLLGVADTAVFLAWDGPRLVIAAASGRIRIGKDSGTEESYSIGDLPVGTVVDLKKFESTDGVKVEILSTDNAVIKEVLEKIPEDARAPNDDSR